MEFSARPLRREPPQPLGNVNYFSVSAATPPALNADPHPSGYSVRVKLDNPHPDLPFRTGELVSGRVHVYAPLETTRFSAPRLSLRVYFESRTLFWDLEPKEVGKIGQKLQKIKDSTARDYENVMKHEVHRGVVPTVDLTLSWDALSAVDMVLEPGVNDGYLEVALPFSFIIPRRMRITEYSEHSEAPRDLCSLERCPPSTLRDSRFGSIQWVVEAIMDLIPGAQGQVDETMLRLPTKDQVLTRLVFPVMPSLEDVGTLRDEPFFGNDPQADSFGCRRLSDTEMEEGKKATMGRIRARGGKWEVYVKEVRMANKSTISSELYAPAGAQFSTHAAELTLVLFLKHTNSPSNTLKSVFRSSKPKPVCLRGILICLLRTISTRGGKEVRPHTYTTLLRRHELRFDDSDASPSSSLSKPPPGLIIPSEESSAPLELDLVLDLQSQVEMDVASGKQLSVPAKDLAPSFRTPNLQHEYLLTVSLWLTEDEIERYAARFPVQFIPSDENQLPRFEDVVGAPPPAFTDNTELPEYGAN